jgi:hypothetical protein
MHLFFPASMKEGCMRNRLARLLVVLVGLTMVAACSGRRPAQMGVDANYVIEVTNPASHAMAVSLNLGANQMSALGSVEAGQTKRFEIRDPSTNDIELVAVDGSGSHTVTKKVELKRGSVARVTLN